MDIIKKNLDIILQNHAPDAGVVEEEDADVHEEMGDERADDDAVGFHKETGGEAIPDDGGGIDAHEEKDRKIFQKTEAVVSEAFPGDVEVDETTDDEHYEVKNQILIVVIFVDEADVHENQHDVNRSGQADRASFLCGDVVQRHENAVENTVHDHRDEQEDDQYPILVLIPDVIHCVEVDAISDNVVKRQQKQDRSTCKRHFIEGFDKFVRARIGRVEERPAGTTVWVVVCAEGRSSAIG